MELKLSKVDSLQFSNYSENSVEINKQIINRNCIIFDNKIYFIEIKSIQELSFIFISNIIHNQPDLILFGFNDKLVKPNDQLIFDIYKSNIGYEIMDIKSLCRTYNFLVAENRKVACIIIFNYE